MRTAQDFSSLETESELGRLFLDLIGTASQRKAARMALIANADALIVRYFASAGADALVEQRLAAHLARPLMRTAISRSCYWPNPDDPLWTTNPRNQRRIVLSRATPGEVPCHAAATLSSRKTPEGEVLHLDFHDWSKGFSLLNLLGVSDTTRAALQALSSLRNGIVVTGAPLERHAVGATAAVLALRPDAVLCREFGDAKQAAAALHFATERLVVFALAGEDPLELICAGREPFTSDEKLLSEYHRLLALSFVYARAKRVCAACARSSAIDPQSLAKLPEVLRPMLGSSYSLGRGCEACSNSAYQGSVAVESLVQVDAPMHALLERGAPVTELTARAYASGTRSMMENALAKVADGLTSIEGALAVCRKLSPAFAALASRHQMVTAESEPARDREVREAFAALDGKYFVGEGKQPYRLLLVEDDPEQLGILQLVFQREGYEINTAGNGQAALELLQHSRVDLVVCDLMMPRLNGAQFIEQVRKSEGNHSLPVLVLTSVDAPETEVQLLSLGADDYCCKSVNRKVLLKRVQRLLEKRVKQGHTLRP